MNIALLIVIIITLKHPNLCSVLSQRRLGESVKTLWAVTQVLQTLLCDGCYVRRQSHCWGSADEGKECSSTRWLRVALLPNTYHLPHAAVSACLVVGTGCCRAPGTACGLLHGCVTGLATKHSQPRCPPGSPQAVPEPARRTARLMSKRGVFLAAPETGLTSRANSAAESSWVMPGQEHSQVQILSFLMV